MGTASFLRRPGRLRRVCATVAAAAAVSGGVVAMTGASASALPRDPACEVQAHALMVANSNLDLAELYYGFFQDAMAAGNNADAETYSNTYRNYDDQAANWFAVADQNPC